MAESAKRAKADQDAKAKLEVKSSTLDIKTMESKESKTTDATTTNANTTEAKTTESKPKMKSFTPEAKKAMPEIKNAKKKYYDDTSSDDEISGSIESSKKNSSKKVKRDEKFEREAIEYYKRDKVFNFIFYSFLI
jgi:hypothetical protein